MFCFIFLLSHNILGTELMIGLCIFHKEHTLFSVRYELNLCIRTLYKLVDELQDP